MAIVTLNEGMINYIAQQAGYIVGNSFKDLPYYPELAEPGVADEAFNLVLSEEQEAQIRKLMPEGSVHERSAMYVSVTVNGQGHEAQHRLVAEFDKPRIQLHGRGEIKGIPGIEQIRWESSGMLITPAKDIGTIQPARLRACLKEIGDIDAAWTKRNSAVEKATGDMSTFLSQYRTLQQAFKAFGPALMEYLPHDVRGMYEAPSVKRIRRPKPEPIEVDIKYLVAHATANKLQLNS